ncbi:unnamed protein product [Protopolystoma xenopodis]|uniref:Uncharacterized protein n=1 Tax=Protopolystoma xenopodis TaxID=117903 RepID=A0A3S4ZRP1_9PLAT|nr:unnamed protein product [Protopolystoma xenopodis]
MLSSPGPPCYRSNYAGMKRNRDDIFSSSECGAKYFRKDIDGKVNCSNALTILMQSSPSIYCRLIGRPLQETSDEPSRMHEASPVDLQNLRFLHRQSRLDSFGYFSQTPRDYNHANGICLPGPEPTPVLAPILSPRRQSRLDSFGFLLHRP